MLNRNKFLLAASALVLSYAANAGFEIKLSGEDKIIFGGYLKADMRYTSGTVASRDYWIGTSGVLDKSTSNLNFAVNETRFNTKYIHGDVTGFIEMDFFGAAASGGYGGANEIFTNSSNPRIRHAFIKYKNILVGQTWSTFVNTSTFAETADFGGALVAEHFVRQSQIRYTMGNLQVALENPESFGGESKKDKVPDVVVRYNIKGDWGNVAIAGLGRQLTIKDSLGGGTKSAFGLGFTGKIKTFGKDDVRFQIHTGETGRYVGVASVTDLVGTKVESSTSYMVAYRHFWSDAIRSTAFYGNTKTDVSNRDRTQWGINIFKSFTKNLSFGFEVGNFEMAEQNANSDYTQFTAKYVL
ncbi:MAG: hypothetical protein JKX78_04450 [Alteromonadaceae bacterium]|nr:hypothetical protein [Alteromonadaceae bacterium]